MNNVSYLLWRNHLQTLAINILASGKAPDIEIPYLDQDGDQNILRAYDLKSSHGGILITSVSFSGKTFYLTDYVNDVMPNSDYTSMPKNTKEAFDKLRKFKGERK